MQPLLLKKLTPRFPEALKLPLIHAYASTAACSESSKNLSYQASIRACFAASFFAEAVTIRKTTETRAKVIIAISCKVPE